MSSRYYCLVEVKAINGRVIWNNKNERSKTQANTHKSWNKHKTPDKTYDTFITLLSCLKGHTTISFMFFTVFISSSWSDYLMRFGHALCECRDTRKTQGNSPQSSWRGRGWGLSGANDGFVLDEYNFLKSWKLTCWLDISTPVLLLDDWIVRFRNLRLPSSN
jgi:hypothetical protein